MTIKHLMYMQKVPFYGTERSCVIISGFEIRCGRKDMMTKVLQVLRTRGSTLHIIPVCRSSW